LIAPKKTEEQHVNFQTRKEVKENDREIQARLKLQDGIGSYLKAATKLPNLFLAAQRS
jgi:hypothetical protein